MCDPEGSKWRQGHTGTCKLAGAHLLLTARAGVSAQRGPQRAEAALREVTMRRMGPACGRLDMRCIPQA